MFYDVLHLAPQYKSDFAKHPGNKISDSYQYNYKKIAEHGRKPDHLRCQQHFFENYAEKLPEQFTDEQRVKDAEKYKFFEAQNAFFRQCLLVAKLHMSFESSPALMALQKLNGLELGTHFRDPQFSRTGQMFISDVMHENLRLHLTTSSVPCGLG